MARKWVIAILMIVSLVLALGATPLAASGGELREATPPDTGKVRFVPGEILVKFKGDAMPFRVVRVPEGRVGEKIREYLKKADVEYAEPNYYAYAFWEPNDEYYSYQWHLDNPGYGGIGMEEAWDISSGSGVTVAIVDTGIAYEAYCEGYGWWQTCYEQAPDLAGTCFVAGYDFVNNDTHPNDDSRLGHGTHVAGTIAQSTNNGIGVAGIAFDACLMPVKVLNSSGSGTYADVAEGIRWAVNHGAHVINLSLGGSEPSQTLEDAVAYAYNNGVTVVAAAGNDGTNVLSYPAAYDDYVIAVGATRYDETLAYYSNFGPSQDLVAPGGDLNVDQNGDGYGDGVLQQTYEKSGWRRVSWGYYFMQGTSMAAPHVSGVAALLIAHGTATTPDEVRAALEETAEDLGDIGWDETYGWGLVDAYAALNWAPGPVDNPPAVGITSPADGATVSGLVTISADASDDVGVAQVDFYCDSTLVGTDGTSPYSIGWDSTGVGDGAHIIKATAIDTASQEASDSISVNVDNISAPPSPVDNPPTVGMTSPADGATVSGLVTISADASDDVGVAQVDFYCDSTLVGTDETSPYSIDWDSTSVGDGAHIIKATAIDTASQEASDSISVNVDNINALPVADAGPDQTPSDADGTGSESVTLDGSGSYDPDGSISSYRWIEGEVLLGTAEVITHNFAVGTHTVTLTVTDEKGASDSDDCIIDVIANQGPTANAGPDQSAYVGDIVNFDGSGSSDPDGHIVSYEWDFGDGIGGSGQSVSHAYSDAGTYTVTLTVADNGASADKDTAVVAISEAPATPTAWVNINLSKQTVWWWWRVTATVTITETDASGPAIADATVYGTWSGAHAGNVSGTTDEDGKVSFRTSFIRGSGTVSFTVDKVVKDSQEYLLDGETSGSISSGS